MRRPNLESDYIEFMSEVRRFAETIQHKADDERIDVWDLCADLREHLIKVAAISFAVMHNVERRMMRIATTAPDQIIAQQKERIAALESRVYQLEMEQEKTPTMQGIP